LIRKTPGQDVVLSFVTMYVGLGHGSGGATTLRFYAAWVAEADHRAADAIGNLMPRRPPPTGTALNP
jgi:hypothetical protein